MNNLNRLKIRFIFALVLVFISFLLFSFPKLILAAPSYTTTASTNPTTISAGSSVTFNYSVTSSEDSTGLVNLEVYDSFGNMVYQNYNDNQNFTTGQAKNYTASWSIPDSSTGGNYTVDIGVFGTNWNGLSSWTDKAASFTVSSSNTSPRFSVTSSVTPSQAAPGSTVNISAAITSQTAVNTLIDLAVEDNNGLTVYENWFDDESFTAGQTKNYNLSWAVPSNAALGTYTASIGIFESGYGKQYLVIGSGDSQAPIITVTNSPLPTPTPSSSPTATPTSTPTPTPTPTPVPCSFTANSALWSTTTIPEASSVNLTVTGSSSCTGQTVNFNIKKNNLLADEDITSLTATFSASLSATTSWTTPAWFDDCGGIDPRVCNPSYHFDAVSGSNSQKSNDLTITQAQTNPTLSNDWAMAGANPQRTSWVASTAQNQTEIPGALRPEWYVPVEPFIHPKFQIIAAYDTIYSSTAKGLYAFDAATGSQKWVYPTELPLGNSPTIYDGVAYVGGLDHKIHAVNALTGTGLWTYEAGQGFDTNPLVVSGTLYAGSRDGYMYALDVTDSTNSSKNRLKWRYQTGGPIRYSAAAKPDNSVIYFASDDASGYAVNTSNGTLAWKQKLPGGYFGSWWPVYYSHPTEGEYVIFSGNWNHRSSLRPGLLDDDWGGNEVFSKEWQDLFPTRLTQDTRLWIAPQTSSLIPGDWVTGTTTLDTSKSNQAGSDYTTAVSEYYEEPTAAQIASDSAGLNRHTQKPWRRTYLVLNPNTGQEVTYDFDNDGQREYAPITTAGITHYSPRFPALVGLNNVLYQQFDGMSLGIPSSGFAGWRINTPYLGMVSTFSNRAVDEPFAFAGGGNLVYGNHCCDRDAGAFDINDLTGQNRWQYFDENYGPTILENLIPGYNTAYIPTPNDDYQDCCGDNYWVAFGGLDGAYGKHDLQNPPIPYKGRVYMHRGNSIIAFRSGATNAIKQPTAATANVQSQSSTVTKQNLQTKLEDEIRKMIAAGHLKPGFFGLGLQGFLSNYASESLLDYFHNPFDTFYTLLRARPLITDATLRSQLDSYIQSEWTNFNPATIDDIGWQEGAWRDSNVEVMPEVTADINNFPKTSFRFNNFNQTWDFNPMAWYAMWMYAKEYGNAETIFRSGVNSVPLMESFVRAMDPTNITPAKLAEFSWAHNGYIAGYIGFANLYDLAVSQGMAPITGNLSTRYPYTVDQLKTRRDALMLERVQNFTKKTPYPNTFTGRRARSLNPSRNFIFMVPELAEYLKTSTANCADGKVSLDCVKDTVEQFDRITPYWFVSKADLGYEESAFAPLFDYNSNFQAKAQILGEPFENLVKYLDVPAFDRGDLFYIQNLTSALQAPVAGTSPSPSATPAPCTISSVSWPNGMSSVTEGSNVNISVQASGECNTKQVHLTVRRQVAILPDADATNQPNPRDINLTLGTNNTATASAIWRTDTWSNACTLTTCNPTFFAKGNIVGETQEVTTDRNNDLIVTQSQTVPTDPNDWPQVQKDPQHTGYSNETFNVNYSLPYEQRFKVAWRRSFPQERIHPQVQTIIYQGKAYAGTENGKLYALNAGFGTNAGQIAWSFNTGSSILNSVAAYNNNIYVATLDGNIFAIDTNGQQVWKRQITQKLGFYTAPIIAENKILIGGRDGNFYAISPSDGNIMWSQSTGTPILHTAAYNNGRVFFGGMNMIVYALNTNDGSISWQSQKLNGMIFKDFYPVVTQGKVIVRPYAKYSTDGIVPGSPLVQIRGASDPNYSWLVNNATTLKNGNAASIPEFMSAQDTIMASYQANPQNYSKNIFILDENTGQESTVVPHWSYVNNIAGGGSMPCVDKDNYLVMPIGMIGQAGWGRLNLNYSTGPRIVDVLYDGTTQSTGTTWTWPDGTNNTHQYPPGFNNRDENLTVTCTQNMIFTSSHSPNLGLSASYSGGYDLTARTWVHFPGGAVPFQMSNSMGGQNPLSISNGVMYHVEDNTIVARTTN